MDIAATFQRGLEHHNAGRLADAQRAYGEVLAVQPNHFDALHTLALVEFQNGMAEQAAARLAQALQINGTVALVYSNYGVVLNVLHRFDEAAAAFACAMALKPDDPQLKTLCASAHNNHGVELLKQGRSEAAVAHYIQAGITDPSYVEAFLNAAATLNSLKRFAEALVAADRAVTLRPEFAPAYQIRGAIHDGLGLLEEAVADYGMALAYDPQMEMVAGRWLFLCQQICRWDGLDVVQTSLLAHLSAGYVASAPFYLLTIPTSLAQQRQAAELYCTKKVAASVLPALARRPMSGKIRVGYFSADFHVHAVSHLTAGLFEVHDRMAFEVLGFTLSGAAPDAMTRRLEGAFDKFIDISALSDVDAASLARELNIDIAVDLTGHTSDGRPGIFAQRAAPVQVSYLGYPGTTGLAAMDYMIADGVLVPQEHRAYYTEKIAQIPSYQVNDWKRDVPGPAPSRQSLGLPDKAFVFCGFNNTYKITPDLFDVWMRLLQKVEGSVLWLRETSVVASANLRREAEHRGVAADRLIFAPRVSMVEHLARHRAADLFLDSFTYNAQTTASDALWSGLPVLTKLGDTLPGRGAASVLTAAGLPELITHTVEAYENLALDMAANPRKIVELRRRLEDMRATCALFDTARFARNIENAYRRMMDIHGRGEPPEDFQIPDVGPQIS